MVNSTQLTKNTGKFVVILYLFLFPLGQLLRFGFEKNFGNLQDMVVLLSIPFYFLTFSSLPKIDKFVRYFFYVSVFSLFLSLNYFNLVEILYGSFYLLRIFSYYTFGVLVFNLVKHKVFSCDFIFKSLILISVVSAIFGWIQYIAAPDLVYLKYMNWDDHLYRLVGTFLDPGFSGMIFTLGAILSVFFLKNTNNNTYAFSFLFLILTTLFTYSRASYLALFVGLLAINIINKKQMVHLALITTVIVIAFALIPKVKTEGTSLLRTASINARFVNYEQTVGLISKNPLFGVGMNNLCAVKSNLFAEKITSHACSGVDSSILFLIATTGIVGLMVFIFIIIQSIIIVPTRMYPLLITVYCSIFVHSLFVQSMFYSFVMGFLALFFGAMGTKESK